MHHALHTLIHIAMLSELCIRSCIKLVWIDGLKTDQNLLSWTRQKNDSPSPTTSYTGFGDSTYKPCSVIIRSCLHTTASMTSFTSAELHKQQQTCLTALFPGQPGWAGTRSVGNTRAVKRLISLITLIARLIFLIAVLTHILFVTFFNLFVLHLQAEVVGPLLLNDSLLTTDYSDWVITAGHWTYWCSLLSFVDCVIE